MRFCLVSEASVPEETGRLLREACAAFGSHDENTFELRFFLPECAIIRADCAL
jgi:hypothetical protein